MSDIPQQTRGLDAAIGSVKDSASFRFEWTVFA
jgi:hypothetical protein